MNPVLECAAWVGGIWVVIAVVAARCLRGRRRDTWQRTPADVHRDAAACRAARDHDECELIWAASDDPELDAGIQRLLTAIQQQRNTERGTP